MSTIKHSITVKVETEFGKKNHKNARLGQTTPLPRPLPFLCLTIPLPCPHIIWFSGFQAFVNETRKIHYFGIG